MSSQALSSDSFFLPDEAATSALGQKLAASLLTLFFSEEAPKTAHPPFPGLRIHLSGPLGGGKTALVRAILRGLGYEGRVRSPTYALLESYSLSLKESTLPVYHFDLYRLANPREWLELGFRDYLDAGALCLIEWPEQAGSLLAPPDCLFTLSLEESPVPDYGSTLAPAGRRITTQAFSQVGQKFLNY